MWGNVPPWIFLAPKVNLKLMEQKREGVENKMDIRYLVQDYVKKNY